MAAQYVDIDLHRRRSAIVVYDAAGEAREQGRYVATHVRDALTARARPDVKSLLPTGTLPPRHM